MREKFKNEAELKIERIDREDGSVVFDVMTAAIHQRYTISQFKHRLNIAFFNRLVIRKLWIAIMNIPM